LALLVILSCFSFQSSSAIAVVRQRRQIPSSLHQPIIVGATEDAASNDGIQKLLKLLTAEPPAARASSDEDEEADDDASDSNDIAASGHADEGTEYDADTEKEITTLEKLVDHAKEICSILPEKEKRLVELKAKGVDKPSVKLDGQQTLLHDLNGKIDLLQQKLDELKLMKAKAESQGQA